MKQYADTAIDYGAADCGVSDYRPPDYGAADCGVSDYRPPDYGAADCGVSDYRPPDYRATDYTEPEFEGATYAASDYQSSEYARQAYLDAQQSQWEGTATGRWKKYFLPQPLTVLAVFVLLVLIGGVIGWQQFVGDQPGGTVAAAPSPAQKSTAQLNSADSDLEPSLAGKTENTGGAAGDGSKPGGKLYVHVLGQVKKPGLLQLSSGARVAEALEKAGGTVAPVDWQRLNLARRLTDGEQLYVYRPGEPNIAGLENSAGAGSGAAAGGDSGSGAGSGAAAGSDSGSDAGSGGAGGNKVSLNQADLGALQKLNGVGPALAQRILDYRQKHGPFRRIDQLQEVSGIGPKKFSTIKPQVSL